MTPRRSFYTFAVVLLGMATAFQPLGRFQRDAAGNKFTPHLPTVAVPFIPNQGQADSQVAFYAPAAFGTVFVTGSGELVYDLSRRLSGAGRRGLTERWIVRETLGGHAIQPAGRTKAETHVSFLLGSDPQQWRSDLPTWQELDLGKPWPGIAASLKAGAAGIEKLFTVEPGADVADIRMTVHGAERLAKIAGGALRAETGMGPLTFTAPVAWQERAGRREYVTAEYHVSGLEYGFRLGKHDPSLPVIIDPIILSSFVGGSGDDGEPTIAIHPTNGDVYLAGSTTSAAFPHTSGGVQPTFGGGNTDAFVARFNSALTTLQQVTFLGGNGDEFSAGIAISATGTVYVVGDTGSNFFPGTVRTPPAPQSFQPARAGQVDVFIAALNTALTDVISTFLGGPFLDSAGSIRIHPVSGEVIVVGSAPPNFPVTVGNAAQPAFGGGNSDAFVARLNPDLTSLLASTFLGGSGDDDASSVAIKPSGEIVVAGITNSTNFPGTPLSVSPFDLGVPDVFVSRLNASLSTNIRSTYLGGAGAESHANVAILPSTGEIIVAADTASTSLTPSTSNGHQPTHAGSLDNFVARLDGTLAPSGTQQATFLGGTGSDTRPRLAVMSSGQIVVVGDTSSTLNFTRATPFQPTFGGGPRDSFVGVYNSALTTGSLTVLSYLGGSGDEFHPEVALDPVNGNILVAGATGSASFPGVTSSSGQAVIGGGSDAFVSRLTADLLAGGVLTVTVTPASSGSISSSPAGINNCTSTGPNCTATFGGQLVALTPTPAAGNSFLSWSGDCTGFVACTLTMNASKNATATFAASQTLTVNKLGPGGGTITSNRSGINCASGCTSANAPFAQGAVVTLTAAAGTGSTFAGWNVGGSGGCTGTGTCAVTMNGAQTVTATFNGTSNPPGANFDFATPPPPAQSVMKLPGTAGDYNFANYPVKVVGSGGYAGNVAIACGALPDAISGCLTTYALPGTSTCALSATTTMCDATVEIKVRRGYNGELSPIWRSPSLTGRPWFIALVSLTTLFVVTLAMVGRRRYGISPGVPVFACLLLAVIVVAGCYNYVTPRFEIPINATDGTQTKTQTVILLVDTR